MTDLRIATWNLWWRFGDPDRRRPSPWTGRLPAAADHGIGNAVLSRWPLREVRTTVLAADGGAAAQVLLQVVVDTPAGTLPVAATHLAPALTASALRVAQVRAVAHAVASAGAADLPPVVVGDFNAEPSSDEMRLLEGHLTAPAEPGLLLADTRRWATDPDAATWRPDNPHVAARGEPPSRVDHVFLGLGRGSVPVTVVRADLFATGGRPGPDGEVWASDHAGVVVDLRAGGGPT